MYPQKGGSWQRSARSLSPGVSALRGAEAVVSAAILVLRVERAPLAVVTTQ